MGLQRDQVGRKLRRGLRPQPRQGLADEARPRLERAVDPRRPDIRAAAAVGDSKSHGFLDAENAEQSTAPRHKRSKLRPSPLLLIVGAGSRRNKVPPAANRSIAAARGGPP